MEIKDVDNIKMYPKKWSKQFLKCNVGCSINDIEDFIWAVHKLRHAIFL